MRLLIGLVFASAAMAQGVFPVPGPGPAPSGGGGGGTTVTFNTTFVNSTTSGAASSLAVPFHSAGLTTGNAFILVVGFQGVAATVSSVCDGTGTGQCTGGSTYNSQTVLRNSTNSFQVWYTCNYQGTFANGLTITMSGTVNYIYTAGVAATGNTTTGTGCKDQYKDNSGTSAQGGAYSTLAMTATTNAHDLLVSLAMNDSGGSAGAGTDGQGNTMTIQANEGGVAVASTFNETATAAFNSTMTGPSTNWEMGEIAIK